MSSILTPFQSSMQTTERQPPSAWEKIISNMFSVTVCV